MEFHRAFAMGRHQFEKNSFCGGFETRLSVRDRGGSFAKSYGFQGNLGQVVSVYVKIREENWDISSTTFYAYPPEIRKII